MNRLWRALIRTPRLNFGLRLAVIAALATGVQTSSAAPFTWNGGGAGVLWATGANWGGTAPTSANTTDLFFGGSTNLGILAVPLSQGIANPFLLNSLTFNAGGGAFFLGGSALRFEGGAANRITQSSSSAESIANAINAPSGNGVNTITLQGTGSGVVTMSGIIASAGGTKDYAIVKNESSTFALTGVNTYTSGTTINAGTIQVNNASSLGTGANTINAGTLEAIATHTSIRNFALGNVASTVLVDSGVTFTANGVFSSTGTLNKTGAGTMVLGGINTFTGGTNVSAGTLQLSAADRLFNTGALTVSGGIFSLQTFTQTVGTVTLTSGSITGSGTGALTGSSFAVQSGSVSAILAGAGALTKSTAGTVTLTGNNTYGGGTNINGGVLALGSGGALNSAGSISFLNGGTLQYSSSNTTDYSARFSSAINQTFSVDTNGQNVTLGTAFASAGGTFNKTGSGTLTLSGSNGYTSSTTVAGGILQVNANNALGTAAGGTSVSSGAALKLNGVNYSTAETLSLNGTGVANGGALMNAGTSTYAGTITAATNATINAGGGTLNLTGGLVKNGTVLTLTGGGTINISGAGISGSSANSDLVVDGTTAVLNTANSYNGPTTIQNSGTLKLGASNVLPSSPQTDMTVNTSSVFDLASNSDAVASLAGDSTATVKNSTVSSTSTLAVNPANGVSTTFAGVIAGTNGGTQGNMALVKSGAGTLNLTGTNTFSGSSTINGGTLIAARASGSALGSTTSITVNSGGTLLLGANDQINDAATISLAGGTISKGNFSEGGVNTVGLGALTLNLPNSHIDFGTGTVGILTFASLNASTFTITVDNWTGNYAQQGGVLTDRLIFDSDQSSNLGAFNFTGYGVGGTQFNLNNGFYEVVAAVPEPATYVPSALAFTLLIGLQATRSAARRRRRSTKFQVPSSKLQRIAKSQGCKSGQLGTDG